MTEIVKQRERGPRAQPPHQEMENRLLNYSLHSRQLKPERHVSPRPPQLLYDSVLRFEEKKNMPTSKILSVGLLKLRTTLMCLSRTKFSQSRTFE